MPKVRDEHIETGLKLKRNWFRALSTDRLTPTQRSQLMSRVGSTGTKPEWILRTALHRLGYRYTVRNKDIFGKPDLAFRRRRLAIFVHGCFWHQHSDCPDATAPKSNALFWRKKFESNKGQDQAVKAQLEKEDWMVLIVWECELIRDTLKTVGRVVHELKDGSNQNEDDAVLDDNSLTRERILKFAENRVARRIERDTAKIQSPSHDGEADWVT